MNSTPPYMRTTILNISVANVLNANNQYQIWIFFTFLNWGILTKGGKDTSPTCELIVSLNLKLVYYSDVYHRFF